MSDFKHKVIDFIQWRTLKMLMGGFYELTEILLADENIDPDVKKRIILPVLIFEVDTYTQIWRNVT